MDSIAIVFLYYFLLCVSVSLRNGVVLLLIRFSGVPCLSVSNACGELSCDVV